MAEKMKYESKISSSDVWQTEDAALKVSMQFFAEELLPYLGIEGTVVAFAPTELVHLEINKLFQDFNLVMEDGSWKHFKFQSENEGMNGLKRFRVYESLASYQNKVPITTYVLFSGTIKNPMSEFTEGINTYRIIPITMKSKNADILFEELEQKIEANETLTKKDLVPLTLCNLMSGNTPQKERVKNAFSIIRQATSVSKEDSKKIEAVVYAMAEKFLESVDMDEIMEAVLMTRLGQKLVSKGAYESKIEDAKNLIDLLSEEIISERIGLPLEIVKELKKEKLTNNS